MVVINRLVYVATASDYSAVVAVISVIAGIVICGKKLLLLLNIVYIQFLLLT